MRIRTLLVAALVLLLTTINVYLLMRKGDVVFIDIGKLHQNYKLKIELEQKAKGNLLAIKNVVDSMIMVRKLRPVGEGYSRLDTNIARLQFELERSYEQSNTNITQQVWDRLNPLIEKFGKKEGYSIVVGATGAGTVLYGDKSYDVTDKLIKYVNDEAVH